MYHRRSHQLGYMLHDELWVLFERRDPAPQLLSGPGSIHFEMDMLLAWTGLGSRPRPFLERGASASFSNALRMVLQQMRWGLSASKRPGCRVRRQKCLSIRGRMRLLRIRKCPPTISILEQDNRRGLLQVIGPEEEQPTKAEVQSDGLVRDPAVSTVGALCWSLSAEKSRTHLCQRNE